MHRVLIVAVAIGLLASCATTPQLSVTDESHEQWQQRQLNLKDLDHWSIRGRVAVFSRDDVYNLGLGWKRQGTVSQVKLEATLGQGVIQLNKSDHSVELTTSEGDRYEGDNAQQVLLNSTGLMIPVEGLESWIKGIPHDNTTSCRISIIWVAPSPSNRMAGPSITWITNRSNWVLVTIPTFRARST
jgi:outer membrane lipoprotein LolB